MTVDQDAAKTDGPAPQGALAKFFDKNETGLLKKPAYWITVVGVMALALGGMWFYTTFMATESYYPVGMHAVVVSDNVTVVMGDAENIYFESEGTDGLFRITSQTDATRDTDITDSPQPLTLGDATGQMYGDPATWALVSVDDYDYLIQVSSIDPDLTAEAWVALVQNVAIVD